MLAFLALGSVNAQINCPITVTPSTTTITAPTTINVNYNIYSGGALPAVTMPNQYVIEFDVQYTLLSGGTPITLNTPTGNHLSFYTQGPGIFVPLGWSGSHPVEIPKCVGGAMPLDVSISNVSIYTLSAPPGGTLTFGTGGAPIFSFPINSTCTGCFTTSFTIATLSATGLPAITGSGTEFFVSKFDCSTSIVNSQIYDNGTNVGVGTINPSGKLHVEGNINIPGTNDPAVANGKLVLGDVRGGQGEWIQNAVTKNQLDYGISFFTAATERMRIRNAGIGIWTPTPVNRLDINGSAAIGNAYAGTAAAPSNGLLVQGNVGIGTTSPAGRLHVEGDIHIPGSNDPAVTNGRLVLGDVRGGHGEWIENSITKNQMDYGIGFTVNSSRIMNLSPSSLNASVDILPTDDCLYKLGESGLSWNELYVCNAPIVTSDMRFKENVNNLEYGLDEILKLRPVTYTWKGLHNSPKKIGFIAQELNEVISEVVKIGGDENKTLGVMYSDLIPVLIKGMQEQHQIIEELQAKLKQLEANQGPQPSKSPSDASNDAANSQAGYLEQNSPNPSEANTVIKLYVSTGVVSSSLRIYDMTGKEIKVFQITTKGEETKITINKGDLPAGMYMYTLLADGKEVDTKKMIISE
ncbi:MAG: tail fiber domain-containing protein [Bacteroidota bacterium]